MASEDAVSDQQREAYLNTYMIDLNTYATNKAMIQNKYEDIREATFRAPFEGMVTKVYQSSGLATGSNVVEFTQLNPIGLEIEMERSKARKIGNKVVKVYPNSINKPQGIIYRHSMLTEKGIIFITENYPLSTYENPDPDAIIHRIFALVIPFQIGTMDTYGVRTDTLSKDEHGDYVWLALNENDSVLPADKNSRFFSVVKVYVEPTGLHRMNSGFGEIHQIKPSTSLKFGDVLIGLPPKHLKDGDKMYLAESKYILMPGETVKVVIEDF